MADTRGLTRAVKRKAQILMKETLRQDEEVDFHPRYERDGSQVNNTAINPSSQEASTEAGSGQGRLSSVNTSRVEELEKDMGRVKSKVNSMDAKLDLLIAAVNPPARCCTPRRHRSPTPHREQEPRLPPPRQLCQEVDQDGYVDMLLQQERFKTPAVEGKAHIVSHMLTETIIPKPYMYINREDCQTIKQKLEARTSLSPMEYVNAALTLVNDKRACATQDRDYILKHIQDVSHDAMRRPWESVRRWSQHIWDAVERKEMGWSDTQLIQNERVNVAMTTTHKLNQHTANEGRSGRQELICRPLNSRAGCRHRSHHDEGQVRLLHICSFCDSVNRHCPGHNVLGCNSKTMLPGQPHPQQGYTQYSAPPQLARQPHEPLSWRNPQQPAYPQYNQYQQASKNAM